MQFSQQVVDLEVLAASTARVKPEFPERQQHEPLVRATEEFDARPGPPEIRVQFAHEPLLPRTWFVSEDGQRLLQFQGDRFLFNWRKVEQTTYPRYRTLRPVFDEHRELLYECIAEAGRPVPEIDFCEVTYINRVMAPSQQPEAGHPDLAELLDGFKPGREGRFLPAPEDATFNTRFRIPDREEPGRPMGRLYLFVRPGFRTPDLMPMYLLRLTANMLPRRPDLEAVSRTLDQGREWIVKGFKDLTSDRMHEVWGLQREST